MGRLLILYKNTAVRLSALFLVLFSVCAAILVFYVTSVAENLLKTQTREAINQEVALIDRLYEQEGLTNLLRTLDRRSRQPDASLYVIAGPTGEILAGNVAALAPGVLDDEGWIDSPFLYDRYTGNGGRDRHRAIAHVMVFDNGMRILVGRDLDEPEKFGAIVRQALVIALGIMGVGALIIWFGIGRNALARIDRMSGATQKIMAGDLSQRLPVIGSGDEFDRMSESLNAMLGRMEKLDEGLRQVSDNIAHDLKTPLTRLRNKAEAGLAGAKTAKATREALEEVISESDQLIRTFNALLMISRVESGSAVAEMSELDLSAIAADSVELYEPVAEDAGLSLTAAISPDIRIRGNRELIGQAIFNLIDNAVKYGDNPDGAGLTLSLARDGGKVRLSVADHGKGIPADKRDDVVRRFVRLDQSRSKPGTGLGLSLVDAVMELHGGKLELSDTDAKDGERRGLTATMVFPASAAGRPA